MKPRYSFDADEDVRAPFPVLVADRDPEGELDRSEEPEDVDPLRRPFDETDERPFESVEERDEESRRAPRFEPSVELAPLPLAESPPLDGARRGPELLPKDRTELLPVLPRELEIDEPREGARRGPLFEPNDLFEPEKLGLDDRAPLENPDERDPENEGEDREEEPKDDPREIDGDDRTDEPPLNDLPDEPKERPPLENDRPPPDDPRDAPPKLEPERAPRCAMTSPAKSASAATAVKNVMNLMEVLILAPLLRSGGSDSIDPTITTFDGDGAMNWQAKPGKSSTSGHQPPDC